MPTSEAAEAALLQRLLDDGFVSRVAGAVRPAARWHAALARAAMELQARGEELTDVRVPITWAVVAAYGDASDDELTMMVWILTRLATGETASLR